MYVACFTTLQRRRLWLTVFVGVERVESELFSIHALKWVNLMCLCHHSVLHCSPLPPPSLSTLLSSPPQLIKSIIRQGTPPPTLALPFVSLVLNSTHSFVLCLFLSVCLSCFICLPVCPTVRGLSRSSLVLPISLLLLLLLLYTHNDDNAYWPPSQAQGTCWIVCPASASLAYPPPLPSSSLLLSLSLCPSAQPFLLRCLFTNCNGNFCKSFHATKIFQKVYFIHAK